MGETATSEGVEACEMVDSESPSAVRLTGVDGRLLGWMIDVRLGTSLCSERAGGGTLGAFRFFTDEVREAFEVLETFEYKLNVRLLFRL